MNISTFVLPPDFDDTGRTVVANPPGIDPSPFFVGESGTVNLTCGHPLCGFALARNLESADQIQNIVFKCPQCGSYSETRL